MSHLKLALAHEEHAVADVPLPHHHITWSEVLQLQAAHERHDKVRVFIAQKRHVLDRLAVHVQHDLGAQGGAELVEQLRAGV